MPETVRRLHVVMCNLSEDRVRVDLEKERQYGKAWMTMRNHPVLIGFVLNSKGEPTEMHWPLYDVRRWEVKDDPVETQQLCGTPIPVQDEKADPGQPLDSIACPNPVPCHLHPIDPPLGVQP